MDEDSVRKETSDTIVTSDRIVRVERCDGVVVARKKERCDDVVDADSNTADNNDVVDGLTDGIVGEELSIVISRRVESGFTVVILVDVETLGVLNAVVTHRVVEEDDVAIEAIDVVEVVEVSDEERRVVTDRVVEITGGDETITIVEEFNILGDNGVLVAVESVEVADG